MLSSSVSAADAEYDETTVGGSRSCRRLSFEVPMEDSTDDVTNNNHDGNDHTKAVIHNQDSRQVNSGELLEERIFLKAALQLLQEKEEHRVVKMISTHPTTNSSLRNVVNEAALAAVASSSPVVETIIKIGSLLKKVSKRWRGVWNVKFLEEVRRGEFYWLLMCVCLCIEMLMNC